MDRYAGALFRELAPMVVEDRSARVREAANKRKVLLACEQAIERIEDGTADLARPDLSLFAEVRGYFALPDLERVDAVIRHHLRRAGIHYATASRRDHLTLTRG